MIALGLVVTASPKHLILVSATAPVSAGRSRPRRFVFIGRLGHPDNGVCDLTQMYGAKYGTLAPNDRVFIQTIQVPRRLAQPSQSVHRRRPASLSSRVSAP